MPHAYFTTLRRHYAAAADAYALSPQIRFAAFDALHDTPDDAAPADFDAAAAFTPIFFIAFFIYYLMLPMLPPCR